ncbi:MAG: FkbM family methyltransferase [Pseudomonadota bacterium]
MSVCPRRNYAGTEKFTFDNGNDWRSRKPKLQTHPLAWLHRKFRLWLNDILEPAGLKVTQRIGFAPLSKFIDAKHIIDVGVGEGTPDLYDTFPSAYLDLFEPEASFHSQIENTILRSRNGQLHRTALGRSEGWMPFVRPGHGSGHLVSQSNNGSELQFGHVMVPVRRLDSCLRDCVISRPSVLKIDTEGYEYEVLLGSDGVLEKIDIIVVEMQFHQNSSYSPNELIGFLQRRSFFLVGALDQETIEGDVHCADLVFQRLT